MSYAKTPGQIEFDRWHAGRVSAYDGFLATWASLDDLHRAAWERRAEKKRPPAVMSSVAELDDADDERAWVKSGKPKGVLPPWEAKGHQRPGWLNRPPVFDGAPIMPALSAAAATRDHLMGTASVFKDET